MTHLPGFEEHGAARGDVAGVRSLARAFELLGGDGDDAMENVCAASRQLQGQHSEAVESVVARLATLHEQYGTLTGDVKRAHAALVRYADGLEQIQLLATRLLNDGEESHSRILSIRERAIAIDGGSYGSNLAGITEVPWSFIAQYPVVGGLWRNEVDTYLQLQNEYNRLAAMRETLDEELLGRLAWLTLFAVLGVLPGSNVSAGVLGLRVREWTEDFARVSLADLTGLPDPEQVNRLWSNLSVAERNDLLARFPAELGNLQGIFYADRAHANKNRLLAMLADDGLSENTRKKLIAVEEALQDNLASAIISFDIEGDEPRVAIAVGDMDTAQSVTYLVHGIKTDVSGIDRWVRAASDLRNELTANSGDTAPAFVAWFRYDSGDVSTVSSIIYATEGARRLGDDIDGLRVVNPDTELVLSGYSYGSTTVGETIITHGEHIDVVHFVGSPGISVEAREATEQLISSGSLHATASTSSQDFIASLGKTMSNEHPIDPRWVHGVVELSSDAGNVDGIFGRQVGGHDAHTLVKAPPSDGNGRSQQPDVYMMTSSADRKLLETGIEELEALRMPYEVGTVTQAGFTFDAIYVVDPPAKAGYFTPESRYFLELVKQYEERMS